MLLSNHEQPQVSSASVNLTTETAVIWPVPEVKDSPNWLKQLGETLANHLTRCGFASSLRGESSFLTNTKYRHYGQCLIVVNMISGIIVR